MFSIEASPALAQRAALHFLRVHMRPCLTGGAGEMDSGDAYDSRVEGPPLSLEIDPEAQLAAS